MSALSWKRNGRPGDIVRLLSRIGFVVVLFLVALALLSVAIRFVRTIDVLLHGASHPASSGPFESRYEAHPYLTLIHVVAGFFFMITGPVQFVESIRLRRPSWHRLSGRIFIVSGVVCAVSALMFVAVLPVFGSFSSSVAVSLGSILFLIAIARAYVLIRRRQVRKHREWMIRAFALGLGIATFRLLLPILNSPLIGASFMEAWDTVTWLGFSINLLVAEAWIGFTRDHSSS
jgi:uncharacterized membrane protein